VYTGVALRAPGGKITGRVADSIVTFRQLSPADIDNYVKCDEGIGKAGGYAIQGRAAALIRFISGSHSNIVGLPLFEVAQMLKGWGYLYSVMPAEAGIHLGGKNGSPPSRA